MMNPLDRNLFFVKERISGLKAANSYDIYNPEDGSLVLFSTEPKLGTLTKIFRFTEYKTLTPFELEISTAQGQLLLRVRRGVTFLASKVEVFDAQNRLIGLFKQKLFSIGGAFDLFSAEGVLLARLRGQILSWDFRFDSPGGEELALITKKWAGLGKELFTSADNYMLRISHRVPAGSPLRGLIVAAVMCIDMVLKE